jgi:hypothetical protein
MPVTAPAQTPPRACLARPQSNRTLWRVFVALVAALVAMAGFAVVSERNGAGPSSADAAMPSGD